MIEILGAGRYPVAFFPSLIRAMLVFVVPVGVVTTLPALTIVGTASAGVGVAAVGLTVPFVLLTRLHWRLALRRYASASS